MVVEIERSRGKKPFLGGFRNKNSGIEFHNASAQTVQKPRPPPTNERFCRDTQTTEQKNMASAFFFFKFYVHRLIITDLDDLYHFELL